MRKKHKRKSGHYVPKYIERLPFNLRLELDILEERTLYDDWIDYRDGFRDSIWYQRYGNKPIKYNKNIIPKYIEDERVNAIKKSVKKWRKKQIIRKIRKNRII